MAGQAGDNREQRRESAGAAATAAASAQSGRFPHRARRPERGRVAGRGKREAEAGGGAGGAVTSAAARRGAGACAGPLAAPCAPSRQRQPTVVLPACSGPEVDLCPSLASPEPGSGLALGRRPGNTCGARASRAGDAEGTARFRPPSLPAPQPVPGAGRTKMNAEPAGSQRSSACGPSAGAPASGVGSLPETQEIAVWRSRCRAQKPRNAPQAVAPSRMTLKAEEDAHRPPWGSHSVYRSLPRRSGSMAKVTNASTS